MIAMLEENPNLKFKSCYNGFHLEATIDDNLLRISESGITSDRIKYLNLNSDWQLVREPVSWQEALQAWIDGKTIKCKYPPNDMKLISTTFLPKNLTSTPTREALITGTWYIE